MVAGDGIGSQAEPPDRIDYSRKWLVLSAVGVGILVGTIDASMVNMALPTLVDEFETSFGVVQWVLLAYLLTQATLALWIGRLGDMIGKKWIFTSGFAVFTAGSVLAGLAPTIGLLIGARVFQAVGAVMIFALDFAVITEAFPPWERGRVLGIAGALVSVGISVGPVLGGFVIAAAGWRWIFFVNVPLGIVGTILAARVVQDLRPAVEHRFDFLGAGLFSLGLLSLMLGLTFGQSLGFAEPVTLGLLALFAVMLSLFVVVERRVVEPMVDLTMLRSADLTINFITGFVAFLALQGLLLLSPFYLTNVLGLGPRNVGLLLAALPITLGIVAPFSGEISDRIGWRRVTVSGLAILLIGYALAALLLGVEGRIAAFVAVGLVIGLGMGLFQPPNNSAIMGGVASNRLGVTSGMLAINRTVSAMVGVAAMGAVWAASTVAHAGGGSAERAPAAAQAAGFSDTMGVAAALVALALALGIWSWRSHRRQRTELSDRIV